MHTIILGLLVVLAVSTSTSGETAAEARISDFENDLSFHGDTQRPPPDYDIELHLTEPLHTYLYMWDGVRVGYTRKLLLDDGEITRTYYMTTLSLDPPIFGALVCVPLPSIAIFDIDFAFTEIPNYLSPRECKIIKQYVSSMLLECVAELNRSAVLQTRRAARPLSK